MNTASKSILLNHDADISVELLHHGKQRSIRVSYTLQCRPALASAGTAEVEEAVEAADAGLIVLLSSSRELENMLRAYLAGEVYRLAAFRQEEDLFRFLETNHNIRTIIMDSVYITTRMEDNTAKKIRDSYSIETLPILLVCPMEFQELLGKEIFQYINDVLFEPFDKTRLTWKIYSMVLLQESSRKSLRTRFDFLQSQMDPHFIFNTLSSILPLCISSPQDAYEMLSDFSDYLRGRLYPQELQHPVFLYQEIDLITAFLAIEQRRFPNRIEYHINQDFADDCTIIPLLIEPIVENCVIHGMKEEGILHINISVIQDDGFVYCIIKDDGKGFDNKDVLQSVEKSATRSIGIKNVRDRLRIYYHEDMYINGVPGEGTEVSFKFLCD